MITTNEVIGSGFKRRFLELLYKHRSIVVAAKGISVSVPRLKQERDADDGFARAWADIEDMITDDLEASALKKAIDGWEETVFFRGKKCGVRRVFSPSLTMKMLAARRPARYGHGLDEDHASDYARKLLEATRRMQGSVNEE